MSSPAHINRQVSSVHLINIRQDNEREVLARIQQTLESGIHQAIVMPSEGIILILTTANNSDEYMCAEGSEAWPTYIAATLQQFGFFDDEVVPLELITPKSNESPQFLVEKTIMPIQTTVYRRMLS